MLTLRDCIPAVEEMFRAYGERRVAPPTSLAVPGDGGVFHVKAAVDAIFAAKINANFPGNPSRRGLPAIQGVIVVSDPRSGSLLGVLDSTRITTVRTAAATAVAAKHLAREGARTATIAGCGIQGRAHLEALALVRPISKAFAYDLDAAAAELFAREASAALGIDVVSARSLNHAVERSDVVVTCTPARAPILDLRHLRPGLLVAGVGADNPDKNEVSPALLARALVVVDVLEQAAAMGDLHHALAAGVMTRDEVHGELADLVCGRVPGRRSDDEVFVFDSTGTALQDVAAASLALARAAERGVGLEIALN